MGLIKTIIIKTITLIITLAWLPASLGLGFITSTIIGIRDPINSNITIIFAVAYLFGGLIITYLTLEYKRTTEETRA